MQTTLVNNHNFVTKYQTFSEKLQFSSTPKSKKIIREAEAVSLCKGGNIISSIAKADVDLGYLFLPICYIQIAYGAIQFPVIHTLHSISPQQPTFFIYRL